MSDPKTPPIPVKIATYHYGEDKDHAVSQDVAISMEAIDDRLSLFVDSTSYKGDITGRLTLNREAAHTLGRALLDFAHPTRPGRVNLAMLPNRETRAFVEHVYEMQNGVLATRRLSGVGARENLTDEWHDRLERVAGKRVHVQRVTTYEGDGVEVMVNLAMSLPVGRAYGGNACKTIVREVSFEVIDETAKPDPDAIFDIDTLILGLPETGPQIRQLLNNALKR